jgi:hypothetical protein
MISIAVYFCYIVSLLFIMGCATRRLLEKISSPQSFAFPPNLVNILILGMISLTTFVSFVSIVSPITLYVHILVIISLSAYIYFDKNYVSKTVRFFLSEIKNNPYLFALGCICIFPVIIMASAPVGYFDTGLYHAQAVKWINEYGTVPGLGNLHHRLAFNSSWFYFSAFFDILAFDGKTAHVVNIIPILLGLIIWLSGFNNLVKGTLSFANILKCSLVLAFCFDHALMFIFIPTLSPDLVVVVLILHVLILVVQYMEHNEISDNSHLSSEHETFLLIFCISFFLPSIKLSSLPVLLFPLLIFVKSKAKTRKMVLFSCLTGAIILLPFLTNNIILSGYLLFPFPQLDLFGFDWKISYATADAVRKQIKYWAIHPTPGWTDMSIGALTTLEWMRYWYARQGHNFLLIWMIRSAGAAVVFFIICFIRKCRIGFNVLAVQSILILANVYWFFSAPAYRFGRGWIWAFILFSCGSLVYLILKSVRSQFVSSLARVLLVLFCISFINLTLLRWDTLEVILGKHSQSLVKVSPLPKVPVRAVRIDEGLVVNVPAKEVAWNADLPSSPYIKYDLRLRSKTLGAGFRIAK